MSMFQNCLDYTVKQTNKEKAPKNAESAFQKLAPTTEERKTKQTLDIQMGSAETAPGRCSRARAPSAHVVAHSHVHQLQEV